MIFKFFLEKNGEIHFVKKHGVSVKEVKELILKTDIFEDLQPDGRFISIGKLKSSGRYLKVVYRKTKIRTTGKKIVEYEIITAYDIQDGKEINFINNNIDY